MFPSNLTIPKENTTGIVVQLVRFFKIEAPITKIRKVVERHPHFPSLLSITDTLQKFSVNTLALTVNIDRLLELPLPFIAHTKKIDCPFLLISEIAEEHLVYISNDGEEKLITSKDFLSEWSNLVVLAEVSDNKKVGKTNKISWFSSNVNRKYLSISFLAFLILAIAAVIYSGSVYLWYLGSFLILKMIGLLITSLMISIHFSQGTGVSSFCSLNCQDFLKNRNKVTFLRLTWAEIGLVYFSVTILMILSQGVASIPILAFLSLATAPFIIGLFITQWLIIKSWCKLCLTIQCLLVLEILNSTLVLVQTSLVSKRNSYDLEALTFLSLLFFIILAWIFIRKYLEKGSTADKYEKKLNELKYNSGIYRSLLSKQKKLTVPAANSIVLGSTVAKHSISLITTLHCKACKLVLLFIKELLESDDKLKIQIYFISSNEKDIEAIAYLFKCYNESGDNGFWHAQGMVYEPVENKKFNIQNVPDNEKQRQLTIQSYLKQFEITSVPAIFIDGYKLPEIYEWKDLGVIKNFW
jgi:hypothetical protein